MIPGLTDDLAGIESVVRAARRAGASAVWWRSLFLKPAAARRFMPFVRGNFPAAEAQAAAFYSRSTYAPRSYDEHLRGIFDRLRRKHGFEPGERRVDPPVAVGEAIPVASPRQLSLTSR